MRRTAAKIEKCNRQFSALALRPCVSASKWEIFRTAFLEEGKFMSQLLISSRRVLAQCLAACVLLLALTTPVAAVDASEFDPDRALAYAAHLAAVIGDRPAGTLGEQEAAGWLAGQFAALGYAVRIQPFPLRRGGNEIVGMNVIATRAGLPDYGVLYAGAHYDTVERLSDLPYGGPGANDNAAGVGVLLEVARLYASAPFTPTLTLIAFGGEEDGLAGSRYFVNHLPPDGRFLAQAMVNFDCVGIGDALHLYAVRDADRALAASLPVTPDRIDYLTQGSSDHAAFSDGGIPAVMFNMYTSDGACGPDYHRPTDTADKLERPAVARVGAAAASALNFLSDEASPRAATLLYLPLIHGVATP
jgi:hypothetical protein